MFKSSTVSAASAYISVKKKSKVVILISLTVPSASMYITENKTCLHYKDQPRINVSRPSHTTSVIWFDFKPKPESGGIF
jgi:hypothetical protein